MAEITEKDKRFLVVLSEDKWLLIAGIFFLLLGLSLGCLYTSLAIMIPQQPKFEWWGIMLTLLFISLFLIFILNALIRHSFIWLTFGKEIVTITGQNLVIERTRGFGVFQKYSIPILNISTIHLCEKVNYFDYTGKPFKNGIIILTYNKDKFLTFGGRLKSATIAELYQTLTNKIENPL